MRRITPTIYNSLTRSKVPIPDSPFLKLYVCGPTVYDAAHIGHGRTYTLFDAMRRVLRDGFGREVIYAMNITDVDDKIIKRSRDAKIPRDELTRRFEEEFFSDMVLLGNERPTVIPRATQYIPAMLDFIHKLIEKGFAYRVADGSVYLDTKKASSLIDYPGVLGSGRTLEGVASEEIGGDKKNASDFALWKGAKPDEGATETWDAAPFAGRGRPGWHLECSAMINSTLGAISGDGTIDIHGGGMDLCFPHHENERCQSELFLHATKENSKPWSTIFCHTGHVTVDSTKMSKSLGNFSTLRQVTESGSLTARQLRLLFLSSSRYASPLEWNAGSIERVKALDQQFAIAMKKGRRTHGSALAREEFTAGDLSFIKELALARERIDAALGDDFDFPRVFEEMQKLCRELGRRSLNPQSNALDLQAQQLLGATLRLLGFGGETGVQPGYDEQVGTDAKNASSVSDVDVDAIFDDLVKFRAKVREHAKAGDIKAIFKICDEVRQANKYITIQDLRDGSSVWRRKT